MSVGASEAYAESLDLTPSPRLLEVLGDIPYKPWQCLAELIDNAFDDFLSDDDRDPNDPPYVRVTLPKSGTTREGDEIVCVADNGRGMGLEAFQLALRAGYSQNSRYGSLGLFGMGFNIATANLGSVTEVRTTRSGDREWLVAEINFLEMQQHGEFKAPLRREPKDDPTMHGTEITVRQLRPDTRTALRRPQLPSTIREQLGKVYSYLLRGGDVLPELTGAELKGRGFRLYVNNTLVRPRLPCVWDSQRSVAYRGTDVKAIQPIDISLPSAWACQDCGHWHRISLETCVECGSANLELRERRIIGWVGIQRYLHTSDFGIDFLRNGRKILISDRSLFEWEHPDTGETLTEYPIELGATVGGRIVGEIHLDHVPVTYQKNDFKRDSRDWITAVHKIRGEGPLQPNKAKAYGYSPNDSYVGRLFNAFRRNEPGLKNLVPGNGENSLHELAREWAGSFRKGLAEFLTDEKWYEAARQHDEIKRGRLPTPPGGGASTPPPSRGSTRDTQEQSDDLLSRTGLGLGSSSASTTSNSPSATTPPPQPETEDERFARYRAGARRLTDLSGAVSVATLGRRMVTVYVTPEPLLDHSGRPTPCVSHTLRGNAIEVFVHGDHPVFREFGRDPRDYAIIEIAEALRALASTDDSAARVAAEVTLQFPDQRFTDAALRERASALLSRVREGIQQVGAARAASLWASLPTAEKQAAEKHAAGADPRLVWPVATENGDFIAHITAEGIAAIIRAHPELVMDGAVFSTTWSTWNDPDARDAQVERLGRLLEVTGAFLSNISGKTRLDLAMMRMTLDVIEEEIADEEST
ncbi:ATP-binding protein [Streptomyces sp. NPDC006875]|uniref:ATP-binding protein n=1 Tax=Streptomyces sp. NPDC006875 TaxID=3154781 RepID=UPI0033EDD115